MTQPMWGPAFEAELAYRRELAAKSFQARPTAPVRWAVRTVRQARAAVASRRSERAALVRDRAREAAARLGDTLDTIAARTDAAAWQERVSDRSVQIQNALDALRPAEGMGRRPA